MMLERGSCSRRGLAVWGWTWGTWQASEDTLWAGAAGAQLQSNVPRYLTRHRQTQIRHARLLSCRDLNI